MDNHIKDQVLGSLVSAVKILEQCREFASLIPEVRVNLVHALPEAKTRLDVAAIEGRITSVGGFPRAAGLPSFGASDHMARLIIEVRKHEPEINAGINFKCDNTVIQTVKAYCKERGWLFGWIDRTAEPAAVQETDGLSMPWKIQSLVTQSNGLPRIFYEGDGWGKEPLFVALGTSATEVVETVNDIARKHCFSTGNQTQGN